MSDAIIVSLISLAGIVISGLLSAVVSSSVMKYRLEQLEKKVDQHNAWGEKFAKNSESLIGIKKDIEYMKEKIK